MMRRMLLRLALVVCLGAVLAGSAFAAAADREQQKFNAADQAIAKQAVLTKADMASILGTGWTGGAKKPDLSGLPACAGWEAKQSDLVLTGAAEVDWSQSALDIDNEVQVLQSTKMIALDWQRTVVDPKATACRLSSLKKALPAGYTFVSFQQIAFPKVAPYSRAYMIKLSVKSNGQTVPISLENVLFGSGRTEMSLAVTMPTANEASVAGSVQRLARLLAGRAK